MHVAYTPITPITSPARIIRQYHDETILFVWCRANITISKFSVKLNKTHKQ